MKHLVFLTFLFLASPLTKANHLPGGSITYTCIGTSLYEIDLILYRECSGNAMIPMDMDYSSSCGVMFSRTGMQPDEVTEVSTLCASSLANSNCNGGALSGYLRYVYRDTIYLSPCDGWTIFWDICCRSASINLSATPGIYIEAKLNNASMECNSSSQFTDLEMPTVCVGQPILYGIGAVDDHAVRRNFSLVDARYYGGSPALVSYVFPNYGGEPIAGMTIDANTGMISFTPMTTGTIVTVVQVDEYDSNDLWIGSVMRDLPFIVVNCSSTPPTASSGSILSTSGTSEIVDGNSLRVCNGSDFCMTMEFSDPNANDVITVTSNISLVVTGATIDVTGTNPLSVTVCGTLNGTNPGTRTFNVTASDNACPIPGLQTYTYELLVDPLPDTGLDGTAAICQMAQPFALIDSLQGTPIEFGTWSGPGGAINGIFYPGTNDAGIYTYSIGTFAGCMASSVVEVSYLSENDSACILLGVEEHYAQGIIAYPNPTQGAIQLSGLPNLRSAILRLIDIKGRMVMERPIAPHGSQVTVEIPEEIANGSYVIVLDNGVDRLFRMRTVLSR